MTERGAGGDWCRGRQPGTRGHLGATSHLRIAPWRRLNGLEGVVLGSERKFLALNLFSILDTQVSAISNISDQLQYNSLFCQKVSKFSKSVYNLVSLALI